MSAVKTREEWLEQEEDWVPPAIQKKFAYARLDEVDRACDGCGERIGRWTKKCSYDLQSNRVYCSTGGCAEKYRQRPSCDECAEFINPFEEEVVEFPAGGRTLKVCTGCADTLDEDNLLDRLNVVEPASVPGVSKGDQQDAAAGPYVVVSENDRVYQVLRPMPGGNFVRSAVIDVVRAVELAARFNRESV